MRPDLVVSDLDGTLLDAGARVTATTAAAVARASARGAEVVIATGRSRWSALPLLEPLDSVRWLICSNGAVVFDRSTARVVSVHPLGDHRAEDVMTGIARAFPEAGFAWETSHGIHYSESFRRNRESARPGSRFGTTSPPVSADDRIGMVRVMVAHPRLVQHEWLDAVRSELPDDVHASTSSADIVEICGPRADKGLALSTLAEQLGVDPARSIAFGDHANDLNMLRVAGRGYVMANADARMHAVTRWRAPHHDDHGVATVLDELFSD